MCSALIEHGNAMMIICLWIGFIIGVFVCSLMHISSNR